ncbi:hypothetical protein G7Y89_g13012 [Cudoniella acicularis]|uniref:Uncharacterized protein n=1 Tax=Cudoniella acicularis TaxID=354080 RepID=A0A8H4RA44_9HELO|nr:hypothetical protein G7Y89_g13012 [Cudoniella acicularis]
MSLLDANMVPFQTAAYPLVTMGLMILAGNTAYPLFLRLIIWSMLKVLSLVYPDEAQHAEYKATLRFVLQYPRRVYTNLFPSAPTWWLLSTVVMLNGIDWAAFEVLNIGNPATMSIPPGYRVLDGLFQALAVRSGGFYVVNIATLRIGLQVLYIIMMYISAYPVVITMRHSNVYEERSLGIYAEDTPDPSDPSTLPLPKLGTLSKIRRTLTNLTPFPPSSSPPSPSPINLDTGKQFVRQQIRGQLAHDLWHRGLPVALDRAVRLPGAGAGERGEVGEMEEEDFRLRRSLSVGLGVEAGMFPDPGIVIDDLSKKMELLVDMIAQMDKSRGLDAIAAIPQSSTPTPNLPSSGESLIISAQEIAFKANRVLTQSEHGLVREVPLTWAGRSWLRESQSCSVQLLNVSSMIFGRVSWK